MIKAVFYKEWIKTRRFVLPAMVVVAAFALYALLRLHRAMALKGAAHVWEVMILRDALFVDTLQFVPLIVGVLLAVAQFAPEMQQRCFKLTLHLPCPPERMVGAMLLYGGSVLAVCFAADYALLAVDFSRLVARELTSRVLWSAAPWFLAGWAGYLLTAWTVLEPAWRRRAFNALVAALWLTLYFQAPGAEAYNGFLPLLGLWTLLSGSLVWLSVVRFKEGCQD